MPVFWDACFLDAFDRVATADAFRAPQDLQNFSPRVQLSEDGVQSVSDFSVGQRSSEEGSCSEGSDLSELDGAKDADAARAYRDASELGRLLMLSRSQRSQSLGRLFQPPSAALTRDKRNSSAGQASALLGALADDEMIFRLEL